MSFFFGSNNNITHTGKKDTGAIPCLKTVFINAPKPEATDEVHANTNLVTIYWGR